MTEPLTIILILISIISLGLYIREYYKRQKIAKGQGLTLDQAQQKSYDVLHQAIKKAEVVMGSAELEAVKITADSKFQTNKFEDKLSEQLEQAITQANQKINQSTALTQEQIEKAAQDYTNFLRQLRNNLEQAESSQKIVTEQRVDQLLNSLQARLWEFLVQIEQRSMTSIELELRSSRQLIERYKQQQLALIDENIVAILERTLSQVLAKRLSLKDQLDLVYDALEKAKLEKFIA